ncbi:MAG: DedA family protein [Euryarchaeota archaeon]|nr:DedA family protein [Euryarchaeota archaeon]
MLDLLPPTLEFLAKYGLIAVFILLVLDGAMLMPVLPGEIVMIMAVTQYADSLLDLVFLIGLATLAAIIGSILLYAVCRKGGRNLIEKHPRLFMMSPRRRERLERVFSNPFGQSLVLFLRIIPLTRILVNIPAGLAKMKFGRFLVLSAIGMLIFHAGFMYLTYEYGQVGSGMDLKAAYASPAWDYVQANQVVTILVALLVGVVLSLRASRNMLKDPEWAGPSVIGWVAERVVFFGGLAILILLWHDQTLIFDIAEHGGMDLAAVAERVNWEPVSFVVLVTATAMLVALLLMMLSSRARNKRREAMREPIEEAEVYYRFDRVDAEDSAHDRD